MKTEAEIRAEIEKEYAARIEAAKKDGEAAAAKAAADAVAADQARRAEIDGLCGLAGFPGKAAALAASGKTIPEIRAELTKLKAENPAGEINPRRPAGTGQPAKADVNPRAIYADRAKARAGRQPDRVS